MPKPDSLIEPGFVISIKTQTNLMANTLSVRNRDISIDVLRFLALTGIVIAHIGPNSFWFQFRQFDVPMMVFLSGLCFTFSPSGGSYLSYVFKRFKRLIIPTWIFLSIYLLLNYCIGIEQLSKHEIILRYGLISGWFTWIVRVFFTMALLAPIVFKWTGTLNARRFWPWLLLLLLLNEILIPFLRPNAWGAIGLTTLGYGIVLFTGMLMPKFNKKSLILFLITNTLIAILLWGGVRLFEYRIIVLQNYKYPPSFPYINYAFVWISVLWLLRAKLTLIFQRLRVLPICLYIGRHSFWIYLWHIPFVELLKPYSNAPVRFAFVYAGALLVAYAQCQAVKIICKRFAKKEKTRREVYSIFCQ